MKRPFSLRIVAFIFLLSGVFIILNLLSTLITLHFLPLYDLVGLLFLLVGNGLLCLRNMWRVCALALNALFAIGLIIIVLSMIIPNKIVVFTNTHDLKLQEHYALFAITIAIYASLCGWIHYVLARRDIRELFYLKK